jgi:hypothetical protein
MFIEMAAQETARFSGWRNALQFSFLCFTFVVLYWFFTLRMENQQTYSPCGGNVCLVQIGRLVGLVALA